VLTISGGQRGCRARRGIDDKYRKPVFDWKQVYASLSWRWELFLVSGVADFDRTALWVHDVSQQILWA
jgi:hypothetical protein